MLQLRACSLPPQSLPRTEPELSSVAVSPPLRKPLVCHHERDRDHGLAERERARGTRWRKGKATTRRPLPAPDTSHHRPSTHPAGLAPRRDGGALCPTVYSSETSLRSCPSRLIDGALIFTLVFTRDTRPHQYGSTHPCPGNTHNTHALCAVSGVMRGGMCRCLCRRALLCARRVHICARRQPTPHCRPRLPSLRSLLSLYRHTHHTHTRVHSHLTRALPARPRAAQGTLRAHTSQTPGGGDGGGGATRLAEHVAAARGQQRASQH